MAGRIDDFSGAAVGVSLSHYKIHQGKAFTVSYKTPDADPLADDGTLEFLIITDSIPLHLTFQTGGNNDLEIVFFEGTTVSNNGTSMPVVGLNRDRSHASVGTAFRDPTISADGDQLFNEFVSWSVGQPVAREPLEWVLKTSTNYLIRVINRAGGTQPVSLLAQWYQPEA